MQQAERLDLGQVVYSKKKRAEQRQLTSMQLLEQHTPVF